jgi:hypothetical protein
MLSVAKQLLFLIENAKTDPSLALRMTSAFSSPA